MRFILPLFLVLILLPSAYAQRPSDLHDPGDKKTVVKGDYVGLEKLPNISPEDAEAKWFHENTLLVQDNEAILDKVPIHIEHGKKWYSASDGGFLTYRARFFDKDNQTFVKLRLFESDYVGRKVGQDPYSEITISPVKFRRGELEINGVRYKRKVLRATERERLVQLLNHEPMEETAEQKAEAVKWMQEWEKAHAYGPPAPASK